jgi:hypothetical protein
MFRNVERNELTYFNFYPGKRYVLAEAIHWSPLLSDFLRWTVSR